MSGSPGRRGAGRGAALVPVPPGPAPFPAGAGPGPAGMARSTLSSRFRRLDIDQYDENRFVEEPEEAAAAEPDAGPEVEALLRQYPLGRGGRGSAGDRPQPPARGRSASLPQPPVTRGAVPHASSPRQRPRGRRAAQVAV